MDPFEMAAYAFAGTLAAYVCGRLLHLFPVRANFEGRLIPVAGLSVVVGVLAGLPWEVLLGKQLLRLVVTGPSTAARIAVLAFAVLGAVDDRWGDRSTSGFRGHIRAALHGHLTTGFVKMIGGGLAALLCGWILRGWGWHPAGHFWLIKAAVIALSANAINLLDTRPARAVLAFLVASASSLLYDSNLRPPTLAGVGAALAFLPLDRCRRAILGDAGSNALGALWGVCFVSYARWEAVVGALIVLVALHVYAEKRSLNADIAAVPLLRRLDEVVSG
jgi:UDP-GlcNAc:undecaprenyl-phosphate GlcNAc-1-phosphate transferase